MLPEQPIKIRELGSVGVVTDKTPADLPYNAFSAALNVSFDQEGVRRAPIFRHLAAAHPDTSSIVASHSTPDGPSDRLVLVTDTGKIFSRTASLYGDLTPAGWTPSVDAYRPTTADLQGVTYVNRPSTGPLALLPGASSFVPLPNWDPSWRCRVLRSFKGLLVALGVTKGLVSDPRMVKWSEFAELGAVPSTWDETLTTNNSGENQLADLRDDLEDGLQLGDGFVLYTQTDAYVMYQSGGSFVFDFQRLGDFGVLTTGCVAEAEGRHYVFGPQDIYVHQGVPGAPVESIAEGVVKRHIFRTLDLSKKDKSFVIHYPRYGQVMFCFPSTWSRCSFQGGEYCNLGAVYSYKTGTWSFVDLPNVSCATLSVIPPDDFSWDSLPDPSWDDMGGSWDPASASRRRNPIWAAEAGPAGARRLLQSDGLGEDSQVDLPIAEGANPEAWVERVGIDLDEALDWRGAKLVRSLVVQASTDHTPLIVEIGSQFRPTETPVWSADEINLDEYFSIDCLVSARWIAVRFQVDSPTEFVVSGYDLNVTYMGGL